METDTGAMEETTLPKNGPAAATAEAGFVDELADKTALESEAVGLANDTDNKTMDVDMLKPNRKHLWLLLVFALTMGLLGGGVWLASVYLR